MRTNNRFRTGFTLTEMAIVLAIVLSTVSILIPAVKRTSALGDEVVSLQNLAAMGVAHANYAADWNGRQVTWIDDDISVYGDTALTAFLGYANEHKEAHPWMQLGECGSPPVLWGYAPPPSVTSTVTPFQPMVFSGMGSGFGAFRIPNAKAFHDYMSGKFYHEEFYPFSDSPVYKATYHLFDNPCEFVPTENPPKWSSYCLSPAAMFHPDVMRNEAAGGWQNPWLIDHGFTSPALAQAKYPDLKTHMLEHHWNQNPLPEPCNNLFVGGIYNNCTPHFFNRSAVSEPAALFYDGSVRLLPNSEVIDADNLILTQTGGVDGLWSRDTPMGELGYFGQYTYDGTIVSHHVLTTDGILGRDTIAP